MAAPAGEDTRKFSPAGGRVRPGSPGCAPHRSRGLPAFKREETSVISICKTVVSGADPEQIRDQTTGLASAPLRKLAAELAADPHLTVSVLTYSDGRQELEVLHTGPPRHTEDTIDHRRFARDQAPARTLPLANPADLLDAVNLIRATLRDAAAS